MARLCLSGLVDGLEKGCADAGHLKSAPVNSATSINHLILSAFLPSRRPHLPALPSLGQTTSSKQSLSLPCILHHARICTDELSRSPARLSKLPKPPTARETYIQFFQDRDQCLTLSSASSAAGVKYLARPLLYIDRDRALAFPLHRKVSATVQVRGAGAIDKCSAVRTQSGQCVDALTHLDAEGTPAHRFRLGYV